LCSLTGWIPASEAAQGKSQGKSVAKAVRL